MKLTSAVLALLLFFVTPQATHGETQAPRAEFDEQLAEKVGADERGMRPYVLVILKTGPRRIPEGPERTEMFKGHFANIDRLANDGFLVLAGPLDGVDGWRGLFIFATKDIDEARKHVETDPVIEKGEMIAEYHEYYGSAALMLLNDLHKRVSRKAP